MNFDQILTKFNQILTIYAKNCQIHVKKKSEMSFSQNNKNPTSKINQDFWGLGYWGMGGELGVLGEKILIN